MGGSPDTESLIFSQPLAPGREKGENMDISEASRQRSGKDDAMSCGTAKFGNPCFSSDH